MVLTILTQVCGTAVSEAAVLSAQLMMHASGAPPWHGKVVAETPFDLKLIGSGFYDPVTPLPEGDRKNLQEIFEEAATFQYSRDEGEDRWQNASVTQERGAGDCEDMAVWIYEELRKNGFTGVRIMVGKFDAADPSYHTWVVCNGINGDDWILDPALQRRIWKRSDLSAEIYRPAYSFDGQFKYAHF